MICVSPDARSYLQQHQRRVRHLHEWQRRWREESLHYDGCFKCDMEQKDCRPARKSDTQLLFSWTTPTEGYEGLVET
jgi:hypothetical protein